MHRFPLQASLVAVLLVVPCLAVFVQRRDSLNRLEAEIQARPEAYVSLVNKMRDALREAVLADDTARVKTLDAFLRTRFDKERIVALCLREQMLVNYWSGDCHEILGVHTQWEGVRSGSPRLAPLPDLLLGNLRRQLCVVSVGRFGASHDTPDHVAHLSANARLGQCLAVTRCVRSTARTFNGKAQWSPLRYAPLLRFFARVPSGGSPYEFASDGHSRQST